MTLPQITPRHFLRYRRQLRAFLIGHEAWFSTRDLRRLLNTDLHERLLANLCDDQRQRVHLRTANGGFEEETVVSESGLHALLFTYCYHPENRNLRRWVTQAVLPELWMYRTRAEARATLSGADSSAMGATASGSAPRVDEKSVIHPPWRTELSVAGCCRICRDDFNRQAARQAAMPWGISGLIKAGE